jgi:hypothetical protein
MSAVAYTGTGATAPSPMWTVWSSSSTAADAHGQSFSPRDDFFSKW